MRFAGVTLFILLLGPQEEPPSRVAVHEETVGEDAYFDLDTGTSLSRASAGNVTADFQFARRDGSLKLIPLGRTRFAVLPFQTLDAFGEVLDTSKLSGDAIDLEKNFALVGRTSEGRAFKASVTLSWLLPRENARNPFASRPPFLALEVAVQENGSDRIPARVRELRVRATKSSVKGVWEGAAKEAFRVRWHGGQRDVIGNSLEVRGLEKGVLVRFEVTRLFANGGEGEPAVTTVFTTPAGPERRFVEVARPRNQDYRINLRAGEPDEIDPDWMPGVSGVRVAEGGGVQWLGEGEKLFESTMELPEYGYSARLERFQQNDVFAIRLRDGRFVKLFVRPVADMRDGLRLEYVLLKGGGRRIESGPRGLDGSYEGTEIRLRWKASADAAEYAIGLRAGDSIKELGRTRETSFAWSDAEKQAFVSLGVAAVDRDGVRSDFTMLEVATFGAPFRIGTFSLTGRGKTAFSLAGEKTVEADEGDLVITGPTGQGRVMTLRGAHGIAGASFDGFGKIDAGKLRSLLRELEAGSIELNPRRAGSPWFRLRSREGGFAHVRLLEADLSQARFQYVYLPHPDYPTMLNELTAGVKTPTEKEAGEIRKLIDELDSDRIEDRERAHEALLSRPSAAMLIDAARKRTVSTDLKARLEGLIRELWERQP